MEFHVPQDRIRIFIPGFDSNPGDTDANPPKIDANYVENVAEGRCRCRAAGQKSQIFRLQQANPCTLQMMVYRSMLVSPRINAMRAMLKL